MLLLQLLCLQVKMPLRRDGQKTSQNARAILIHLQWTGCPGQRAGSCSMSGPPGPAASSWPHLSSCLAAPPPPPSCPEAPHPPPLCEGSQALLQYLSPAASAWTAPSSSTSTAALRWYSARVFRSSSSSSRGRSQCHSVRRVHVDEAVKVQ